METEITISPEEDQELIEKVYKLSAKDIDDKLRLVSNRPEIAKRRWFWELLQNAKDSVNPSERISVKMTINSFNEQPYVEFLHNGNPFQYQDVVNLIFPYSDKVDEENSDKSGRFGTGFLATHILSKQIKVMGVCIKDQQAFKFNFLLDRTGIDKLQIAESIKNSWQEFKNNRVKIKGYNFNKENFETSFRYNLDTEGLKIVSDSLTDYSVSLPFTLSFIPKIEKIEIENKLEGTKTIFSKKEIKKLTENINKFIIEKIVSSNSESHSEDINIIICTDGKVDIALEIFEQGGVTYIKKFLDNQPFLFCAFPLIGSNELKFPTIVNSTSFIPKEERNGIWLDNAGYGPLNQTLFEKTISLYQSICQYISEQGWKQTYLLFKSLNENISITDFNEKWFNEKIKAPLRTHALTIPLADIPNGKRVPASIINFSFEKDENFRLQLWGFIKDILPDKVIPKSEVNDWYEVLFEGCIKADVSGLTYYIAKLKTLEGLQNKIEKSKEETQKWLNTFVTFITKVEPTILDKTNCNILPNQLGIFKLKNELYLDDGTIDEDLKEILAIISKFSKKAQDWRFDMLDKQIFLQLPQNRVRNIAHIGTTITEAVKELLKDDSPTNELRDIFSRLLNWLTDNPDKAKGFFKGLKTDTLLYKCADEKKMGKFTEMFKLDRDGKLKVDDQIAFLNDPRIHLLKDPELELKVNLGEQVLLNQQKEKEEFEFKKRTGNIFETLFLQLVKNINRFTIEKIDGEEDFLITNKNTGNIFYVELKSIRIGDQQIQMTHKQAKKASNYPNSYFLCIIPNNGDVIDESYFITNAKFDSTIGTKLSKKVKDALAFEAPEPGIIVEFEDKLLSSYKKYRYKFNIQHSLWGQDNFDTFISLLS